MLKNRNTGFTIVELLIVIVVIAILAAISIVAYNGIQQRANDAQIKAAANDIQKAVQLWYVDVGQQPKSGSGSTGPASGDSCPGTSTTAGWFSSGIYNCSMENLLVSRDLLKNNFTLGLPPNKANNAINGRNTFMMYPCGSYTNQYMLMWYLNVPSTEDIASYDYLKTYCGTNDIYRTNYGMRAGKIIQL